jgi:hypothetical protein
MRRCLGWTWPAVLVVLACLSCGKPTGKVSGVVTYRGEPLNSGTVTFLDGSNLPVGSSAISPQGAYSVSRVPVGTVKILVTTPHSAASSRLLPPPPRGKEAGEPIPPVTVPLSYGDTEKSDLSYTVTVGDQEHPIVLK